MHDATVRRGKKSLESVSDFCHVSFSVFHVPPGLFFSWQKKSTIHPPHFLFLPGLNAVEACTLTVQPEKNFIHSLWYCAINVTSSLDTYLQMLLMRVFLNILTQCVANSDRKLTDEAATSKHLAMMEKQQQLQIKVCLFVWGSWVQRQV